MLKPTAAKINKPLLITAVTMFSLATAHVMIGLRRALAAFLESSDLPGGALGYYAEISNWLSIFKQALYATNK